MADHSDPGTLRLALAQLNPVVGAVQDNAALLRKAREQARDLGADLVVASELVLVGYPPEDLVLKPALQDDAMAMVERLAAETGDGGPGLLIGTPWREGAKLYNAAVLLAEGRVQAVRYKHELPNYGVFDEKRVFEPGPLPEPVDFKGVRLGLPICEDIWGDAVTGHLKEQGCDLFCVLNGSPYRRTVYEEREAECTARVREAGVPMVYVNQVGGQDELVFDGASFVMNPDCSVPVQSPAFDTDLRLAVFERGEQGWGCLPGECASVERGLPSIYRAVTLALRDYVDKNRFPGVVLGLSGGIDSALSAAFAVDALGPERVRCVMLPSRYTSSESLEDAAACANALGVHYESVPIEEAVDAFSHMLSPVFGNRAPDTTEENIQSRIRGVTLMAISNKFGPMLLTTGNKSEMSVGYATIYGDMSGGYNPLKDLYKTLVFDLSRWRNAHVPKGALGPAGEVIPQRIIDKPPSAELRPDQKDEDSLPPYEALDDILECLVEGEMTVEAIEARGHDMAVIKRIEHLLYVAEYKRRQAPPGVKISLRNFGRDRRYPVTNAFRDAV